MASARRAHAIQTTHRPNPLKGKLAKAHERIASLSKRGRAAVADQEMNAITVGAPLALGFAESKGVALPTVFGLDPSVLYGGVFALAGLKFVKGKNGKRLMAAGVGLLASGARDSAKRGGIKVGEDEIAGDDDDSVGAVEDYDDD